MVLGSGVLAILVAAALAGQLGSLVGAAFSLGQLPLLAITVLAWLAPRSRAALLLALGLLYASGALLAGFTLWLASLVLADAPPAAGLAEATLGPLAAVLVGLLLAPVLLLPHDVRVTLARIWPLDPDVPRHWIGLIALVWFTAMPIAALPLMGGRPPLEVLLQRHGPEPLAPFVWQDLLYSLAWTVLLCLAAVGYPAWTALTGALRRLGLTWPGWRSIGVGLGLSVAMVPMFFALDYVTAAVMEAVGLAPTSSAWIDQLFGRTFGLAGAVAAAVTAGLGEELIWRGVIQPRYGLPLAALGFAAMHGFQYGPDGLLSVLAAGLLLGLVRARSNTTVAAVMHGGYDLWLLLGTLAGWW